MLLSQHDVMLLSTDPPDLSLINSYRYHLNVFSSNVPVSPTKDEFHGCHSISNVQIPGHFRTFQDNFWFFKDIFFQNPGHFQDNRRKYQFSRTSIWNSRTFNKYLYLQMYMLIKIELVPADWGNGKRVLCVFN